MSILNGGNDFTVFYHAGFLTRATPDSIDLLYDASEYLFPFRYLPMTAYLFWAFTWFQSEVVAYFFFTAANFLINIPIIVMIYHIIFGMFKLNKEKHEKRVFQYIAFYLGFVPHVDNYVNGQVNSFVAFFILCSLYFFEYSNYMNRDPNDKPVTHNDLYGGICLGLAILTKITAIILVPFVIVIKIVLIRKRENSKKYDITELRKIKVHIPIKTNFYRLIFPFLLFCINVFLFIVNPGMFEAFLNINLSGSGEQVWRHSFSMPRLILNAFELFGVTLTPEIALITLASVFIPVFLMVFWSYARNMNSERILPMYYSLGLLTLLVGYFDAWAHHLIVLIPFLIISIVQVRDTVTEGLEILYPKGKDGKLEMPEYESPQMHCIDENHKHILCLYRVHYNDYKMLKNMFIASSFYFWTLFYFITENLFYSGSPGFNIFYGVIIFIIYFKLIQVLNRR